MPTLSPHPVPPTPCPGATPSSADVRLEASDLRLTLSPDVLELGGLLAASALEPLMQPQPDQPLASCNQFERVWSYDPAGLFSSQPGGAPAVSLAVTGAEGGVTVWRAKTPTGYAVAGDVVTPGASQVGVQGWCSGWVLPSVPAACCPGHACYACHACHATRLLSSLPPGSRRSRSRPPPAQPTFEVMAVAVNSGLAAYPTSYTRVWAGGGAAIWRPVAPQGYVSVGDLFSADGAEPELSAMVCLHGASAGGAASGQAGGRSSARAGRRRAGRACAVPHFAQPQATRHHAAGLPILAPASHSRHPGRLLAWRAADAAAAAGARARRDSDGGGGGATRRPVVPGQQHGDFLRRDAAAAAAGAKL